LEVLNRVDVYPSLFSVLPNAASKIDRKVAEEILVEDIELRKKGGVLILGRYGDQYSLVSRAPMPTSPFWAEAEAVEINNRHNSSWEVKICNVA